MRWDRTERGERESARRRITPEKGAAPSQNLKRTTKKGRISALQLSAPSGNPLRDLSVNH